MPNVERNIPDGFASDIATRRPMRFVHRPLGLEVNRAEMMPDSVERRISCSRTVMEALRSLEFEEGWGDEPHTKHDAGKALDAVLAGGDIDTTVHAFFDLLRTDFRQAEASAHTSTVTYPNDLWKREPFFGAVTPFHTASVAAAIRKRPDLVALLGEWNRVFDKLHRDDFPEVAPENIEKAADELLCDVLKFATFKASKLETMTVMVGQHLYQIRKRACNDDDVLETKPIIYPLPAEKRKIICATGHVFLEDLHEGRMLSASLLIQENRILAMGADDTTAINQIFVRENLGNLLMTEHNFFQQEAQAQEQETRKVETDGFDFDIDFDIPEEKSSEETKHVPLSEEFFDLIAEAVSQACGNTRAIFTARVLITDTNVRVFAYNGDRLWGRTDNMSLPPKLDNRLLENLHFGDFEQEIADIERLAGEAVEAKIVTLCHDYLDFAEAELLDPINKRMVEILVRTVKARIGNRQGDCNYRQIWEDLESVKPDAQFFMNAVIDGIVRPANLHNTDFSGT